MSVTLLFGGTFDPVHAGHIALSRALLDLFDDAQMILVPCQIPVHRDSPVASASQRYDMLELATRDIKNLRVDDCELRRSGPSYTIDTLREYRRQLGVEASLVFVMGMDSWLSLPTWHCWQEMCDLAHLMILPRAGDTQSDGVENGESAPLRRYGRDRVTTHLDQLVNTPCGSILHPALEEIDISATRVRDLLNKGELPVGALAPEVHRYILQHGLYGGLQSRGNRAL